MNEEYLDRYVGVASDDLYDAYGKELLTCIAKNDVARVKDLVVRHPELLWYRGAASGWRGLITPFQLACYLQHPEICKIICDWVPSTRQKKNPESGYSQMIAASDEMRRLRPGYMGQHEQLSTILLTIKDELTAQRQALGEQKYDMTELFACYRAYSELPSRPSMIGAERMRLFKKIGRLQSEMPIHLLLAFCEQSPENELTFSFFASPQKSSEVTFLNHEANCHEGVFDTQRARMNPKLGTELTLVRGTQETPLHGTAALKGLPSYSAPSETRHLVADWTKFNTIIQRNNDEMRSALGPIADLERLALSPVNLRAASSSSPSSPSSPLPTFSF